MADFQIPFRSEQAEQNGFAPRPGFRPFHLHETESTLASRFREVAGRHAQTTAVSAGDLTITYEKLFERVTMIAGGLRSRLPGHTGPIAIILPLELRAVEAILGALFAGFTYFPIDPSTPDARIVNLIGAARPAAVLADGAMLDRIAALEPSLTACLIDPDHLVGAVPLLENPNAGPEVSAALFTTSGSTGEPKLVALSHRAILFDIGRQTNDLCLGPDDRFDLLFSFAFSASLAPLFGALLNGGELHLLDLHRETVHLLDWLEDQRITVSSMTISTFRAALSECRNEQGRCGDLRLLSLGGERMRASDVAAFRTVFGSSSVLQNAMAATETRTYAQYFVPRDGPLEDPVPIGWQVYGKEVLLLDERGVPLRGVAEGEIAVRSQFLATGYVNDATQTEKRFIHDDATPGSEGFVVYRTGDWGRRCADGRLFFVGRSDSLVKIRGHRVELEAVEAAICRHSEVRECAAIAQEQPSGDLRLVAYFAGQNGATINAESLRSFLRLELPDYMIPSAFVELQSLPLTGTGKIDRRNLPAPQPNLPNEIDTSQDSPTIRGIRAIWSEILEIREPGTRDTFATLGGDSLKAWRVLLNIEERFGCVLPPGALWSQTTIRQLAELVDASSAAHPYNQRLLPFQTAGSRPPVFFVHAADGSGAIYEHLARLLGTDRPIYGIHGRNYAGQNGNLSIEKVASEYVGEVCQVVPTGQSLILVGYSLGGTIAFEMARQMELAGGRKPVVVIIDMAAINAPHQPSRSWVRATFETALNFPRWFVHDALTADPTYLFFRARARIEQAVDSLKVWATGCEPREPELFPQLYFGTSNVPASYMESLRAIKGALERYVPRPYAGSVVLLRTRGSGLFARRELGMGWRALAAGRFETSWIPGSHATCLWHPNVATLARTLRAYLDMAEHDPGFSA